MARRVIDIQLATRRCWIGGRRVHHGPVGLPLLFSERRTVRLLGAVLLASDWHDRREWLPDLLRHPKAR